MKKNKVIEAILDGELNKKDLEIMFIISNSDLYENVTMRKLADLVGIAPTNLWKHMKKLQKLNIMNVPHVPKGKPKYAKLTKDGKVLSEVSNTLVYASMAKNFPIKDKKKDLDKLSGELK